MALTIHDLSATQDVWVVDRRLWLTADQTEAVEDGDPRAAFLLAGPGQLILRSQAEKLGLLRVAEIAEQKQAEPPEDKQLEPPEDKAVKPIVKPEAKRRRGRPKKKA